MISVMNVVVPAHDEERDLGNCIAALREAAADPSLAGIAVRLSCRCSDVIAGRQHTTSGW